MPGRRIQHEMEYKKVKIKMRGQGGGVYFLIQLISTCLPIA
jgi:hypothetical protein